MPTCFKNYQDAINRRTNHPLRTGDYKLKETLHQMKSFAEEVRRIAAMKNSPRNKSLPYALHHCTQIDCGQWLKDLPTVIVDLLGYNVLPGIRALGGDGVTQSEVKRIESMYLHTINRLVADCESVRRVLKGGIGIEYGNFKRGDSWLAWLADDAVDLIEGIMTEYTSVLPFMGLTNNSAVHATA